MSPSLGMGCLQQERRAEGADPGARLCHLGWAFLIVICWFFFFKPTSAATHPPWGSPAGVGATPARIAEPFVGEGGGHHCRQAPDPRRIRRVPLPSWRPAGMGPAGRKRALARGGRQRVTRAAATAGCHMRPPRQRRLSGGPLALLGGAQFPPLRKASALGQKLGDN